MDLFFTIKGNELWTYTTWINLEEIILIKRLPTIPEDSQVIAI